MVYNKDMRINNLKLYNRLKSILDISFHDLLRCQVVIGR